MRPIIFFDGYCGLCNKFITYVQKRTDTFLFAPLTGKTAKHYHLPSTETIVLIDDVGIHTKSTAVLRILYQTGKLKPLWSVLFIIPRFIRDALYWLITKIRYKVFGKQRSCRTPTKAEKERFLP
ncbi:DUF393 domain-containing protein [Candidatus Woesearchaeota archaeon]|nr:MAG: DUF393 domain-containing protein [Candidatus Woesearchaeota archaeon]